MIFCHSSGDIYFSLSISLSSPIFSASFVTAFELFCCEVLENFMILSSLLLPLKSPVASTFFFGFLCLK